MWGLFTFFINPIKKKKHACVPNMSLVTPSWTVVHWTSGKVFICVNALHTHFICSAIPKLVETFRGWPKKLCEGFYLISYINWSSQNWTKASVIVLITQCMCICDETTGSPLIFPMTQLTSHPIHLWNEFVPSREETFMIFQKNRNWG